jgi:hypothetical protein
MRNKAILAIIFFFHLVNKFQFLFVSILQEQGFFLILYGNKTGSHKQDYKL